MVWVLCRMRRFGDRG